MLIRIRQEEQNPNEDPFKEITIPLLRNKESKYILR